MAVEPTLKICFYDNDFLTSKYCKKITKKFEFYTLVHYICIE
jgi:hypothetical protein